MLMRWHIVTSEEFKAGVKFDQDMYFLTDTHEIYRGNEAFTQSVILYTELPTTGIAINRLYVNSTTLEGKIHNGVDWITVIKPVEDKVDKESPNPVSGKAIAAYIATLMAEKGLDKGVIQSLSWDSAEHILTTNNGESKETIVFDGLGVSLNYVPEQGALRLLDAKGNPIGKEVHLDLEKFIVSGEYNSESKNIILYFDIEKKEFIEIPVGDLIDEYKAEGDNSLSLSIEKDKIIKGSVKISKENGNMIILKEDGIYVSHPVIVTSENLAESVDSASEERVISEKLFLESLTWKMGM